MSTKTIQHPERDIVVTPVKAKTLPALHAAVSADYAASWPDLTPPSLAECEAFCALAIISTSITDTPAP